MIRREEFKEVEGLAGGHGKALKREIVSKSELYGHGRLYAHIKLNPGSCVGWHQHEKDTEPYYILKGEGDFYEGNTENGEKIKTHVKAGDVCVINVGQWHSLENNSNDELEFIALIYNEPGYLI